MEVTNARSAETSAPSAAVHDHDKGLPASQAACVSTAGVQGNTNCGLTFKRSA